MKNAVDLPLLCEHPSLLQRGGVGTDEEGRECDLRPHKIAICSKLDDLTQEGREIGACNTVILKKNEKGERILVGHNTEYVSDLFALSLSLSKIRKR